VPRASSLKPRWHLRQNRSAGTGTYRDAPGPEPTGSGDLVAPLLGLGTVPLTGTGFTAGFCRADLSTFRRCL